MNKFIDYLEKQINSFLARSFTGYIIYMTGSRNCSFSGAYLLYKVIYLLLKVMAKTGIYNIWIIIFSCYVPFMLPALSTYEAYYEVTIRLGKGDPVHKAIIKCLIDLAFVIIQNLLK